MLFFIGLLISLNVEVVELLNRPILNIAHDAATNNGAAIISKRVSINDNPFKNILISYILYYIQFLQIDSIENLLVILMFSFFTMKDIKPILKKI